MHLWYNYEHVLHEGVQRTSKLEDESNKSSTSVRVRSFGSDIFQVFPGQVDQASEVLNQMTLHYSL